MFELNYDKAIAMEMAAAILAGNLATPAAFDDSDLVLTNETDERVLALDGLVVSGRNFKIGFLRQKSE